MSTARFRRLAGLLTVAVLIAASAVPTLPAAAVAPLDVPVGSAAVPEPPEVSAESWILYDATFDVVLDEFNPDEPRPMASTTKMMTALLAIESDRLDEDVTVSQRAADVGESEIGLEAGEVLTLRQLVTALMIRSANDAAVAVAEHLGGSVEGFVEMMNARAAELGLTSTSFANPHGLDAEGHYSSARDLLHLAIAGMEYPLFAELARTKRAVLPPNSEDDIRVASTTNRLLSEYDGMLGIKTGYTEGAGRALVAAAEKGDRTIYAVVLGSEDHFGDIAALLDHGFESFRLYAAITAGGEYGIRRAPDGEETPAIAEEGVSVIAEPNATVTVLPEIREGAPVLVARVGTEEVGTTPVQRADLPSLPSLLEALRWLLDTWAGR